LANNVIVLHFSTCGSVPRRAEFLTRQPESLIGQVRRDGKPYPADPNWHDCAFNSDLPSTKQANRMKETYQKEEHCRD
jgi:hypothetical protein